jgi:hypothetical protein
MVPLLYFNCSHPELLTPFPKWKTWEKARGVPDATAVPYWIIMKSKTPEKFEKLLPNDYWLPVPWRFYAWHPHHTCRDRSCFFTHDIVYQQHEKYILRDKGFKDKTCIIFEIYL